MKIKLNLFGKKSEANAKAKTTTKSTTKTKEVIPKNFKAVFSSNIESTPRTVAKSKKEFPTKVPFWARLKINKRRTTLIIDKEKVLDKKTNKIENSFVHREATHTYKKGFEELKPNPDKSDNKPMYLKRPSKLPIRMFELHNKDLEMLEDLVKRYDKNNKKE